MNKKLLLLVPLFFLLAACNSLQYSKSPSAYIPDPFWDNPRIVFRDVTVPPGKIYDYKSKVKKYPTYKKSSYRKKKQTLALNNEAAPSVNGIYGSSINDSFNGVIPPVALQTQAANIPQNNSMPLNTHSAIQPSKAALMPAKPMDTQQVNSPPGTTYVPLTFPVPPPKSMMQQFHMQIGQNNSDDTSN